MSDRYCYDHPRPAVTVDIVLFRRRGELEVLLVQRRDEPFAGAWAFPGGFVEQDEPLDLAAERELKEETRIEGIKLRQFGAFGDPGRDPRGHTVTIAFTGEVADEVKTIAGDDAAAVRWFPISRLPRLAFDHDKILAAALEIAQSPDRKIGK